MDTNTVVWAIGMPLFLFFVAMGVTTVFALTSSDSTGFIFAKACFATATVIFVGTAVFWSIATRQVLPWSIAIPTVAALFAVPALVLSLQWVGYREMWLSTKLFPGNGPTPSIPAANIPPNALKVLFGSSLAWATRMPHTILEMAGEKMIEINRTEDGLTVTTLKIFDDRNDIIARIDEDGFWVTNTVRKKRPDPSTLVVYDHNDAEVLRIVLINPTTLRITGTFRHSGVPNTVVITENSMSIGTNTFNSMIFGENRVDIGVR